MIQHTSLTIVTHVTNPIQAILKRIALLTIALLVFFHSISQSTDSTALANVNATIKYTIQQYLESRGKGALMYNGAEYIRPFPQAKGSPFLDTGMQKGSIYFDGIWYPDVQIAYDLVNQEVITTGYQNLSMRLVPEKVGYFYISERLFIPADRDSITYKKLAHGYYEVLYNHDLLVLAHYQKLLKRLSSPESPQTFVTYTNYFILNNNSLYLIENEKSLIAAFPSQKGEVKQFIRSNHLKFKKTPAETILKTVVFSSQLKH